MWVNVQQYGMRITILYRSPVSPFKYSQKTSPVALVSMNVYLFHQTATKSTNRLERVLASKKGVWVFAPQHPSRKGMVLGQLQYMPISKTILIAIGSSSYDKNAEKF